MICCDLVESYVAKNNSTVALIAKERDLYGNIAAFEHKSGKE